MAAAGTLCALAPAVAVLNGRSNREGTARQSTISTTEYTRASGIRTWTPNSSIRCKSKPAVVCFAGTTPEDSSQKEDGEEQSQSDFVAPRVTPDYVGNDSIKPPPRVTKNLEGPQITGWGGNVRGGKYEMGQGTDRIIDIFANGNAMLVAAGGLLVLFLVLLQFRPDAPPPPPPPSY